MTCYENSFFQSFKFWLVVILHDLEQLLLAHSCNKRMNRIEQNTSASKKMLCKFHSPFIFLPTLNPTVTLSSSSCTLWQTTVCPHSPHCRTHRKPLYKPFPVAIGIISVCMGNLAGFKDLPLNQSTFFKHAGVYISCIYWNTSANAGLSASSDCMWLAVYCWNSCA